MRVNAPRKGEQVETIGHGPIPEINLGPVAVAGQTPGAEGFEEPIAREGFDVQHAAPVMADATSRGRKALPEGAEFKKERTFRVLNPGGKHVNDPNGGGRVHLHEGKELKTTHYNLRELQKQGVKLQEVTDVPDDMPVVDVG